MNVQPDELLAGIPLHRLRAVLKGQLIPWDVEGLGIMARVDADQAVLLARALVEQGYWECAKDRGHGGQKWSPTIKGFALAEATCRRPARRVTAEAHLRRVVEFARRVRHDNHWGWRVRPIWLYGELLEPGRDLIGEIDLGVTFVAKWTEKHDRPWQVTSTERWQEAHSYREAYRGVRYGRGMNPDWDLLIALRRSSRLVRVSFINDQVLRLPGEERLVYAGDEQSQDDALSDTLLEQALASKDERKDRKMSDWTLRGATHMTRLTLELVGVLMRPTARSRAVLRPGLAGCLDHAGGHRTSGLTRPRPQLVTLDEEP